MAQRKGSRGRAIGAICLGQDVPNVNRDRAFAEQQAMGNFAVGLSGRHEAQHLEFAHRKSGRKVCPGHCTVRPASSSLRSAGGTEVWRMDDYNAKVRVPPGPTRHSATRAGRIGGSVVIRWRFRSRSLAGSERYSFNPTLVAVLHPVDVKARSICVILAATLTAAGAPSTAYTTSAECADDITPASVAALKPADVLLTIRDPRAGETITETGPEDSVSVAVDYWGPSLIAAYASGPVDQYHLAYLLDVDATPYIGTLLPVPHCDPHIQHTADRRAIFGHVPHGIHTLAVLLTGSNNVSVNPPVAMRETFMVR
jgi:hypothetical protein